MASPLEQLNEALAGRYEIEKEIGQGGMATVYLATDIKHERQVAVKVLRPELAAALGAERFVREIKIAAKLQHPHILPLLDSGEASGMLYYVMPYIKGESLRDYLDKHGELPINDAIRIIREVVDALAQAHAEGLVHRDVKPDNVMISGRHVMVTDFGVAKALSEAKSDSQLTTAGVALGTPAYMAPEQATADPNTDHRADIYAVGAMAYELLSGRPPFSGQTPQQILSAHVTQEVEPVSKYRTSVPPALDQFVMKCLQKNPADRWQSAEDMLNYLETLSSTSGDMTPVQTRPVSAVLPAARAGNRNAAIIAAAIVGAGALAAVGFWLKGDPEPAVISIPPERQVTFRGDIGVVEVSPDGQTIAYTVDDNKSLVIQDLQGGGSSTILTHPDENRTVGTFHWSADGSRLYFQARLNDVIGIYSLPKLGGTPSLVADINPIVDANVQLTFWRPTADGRWMLGVDGDVVIGPDIGDLRFSEDGTLLGDWQIIETDLDLVASAELSPDGQWIAYSSLTRTFDSITNGVVSLDGQTRTYLGGLQEMGFGFTVWNADGDGIFVLRPVTGAAELGLLEFNPRDGTIGELRMIHPRMPDEMQGVPNFSADRSVMVYTAAISRANVKLMRFDGANGVDETMLTRGTATYQYAEFSADGEFVFFLRALQTFPDGELLYLSASVEGGEQRTLGSAGLSQATTPLSLSPDGTTLAASEFDISSGLQSRMVLTDVSTGRRRILDTGAVLAGLAWSPDGSKIVGSEVIAEDAEIEQLGIVDVASGELTYLRLQCDTGCGFSSELVAMSPEWPMAAVTSDDDLWIANLEDGSLSSLVNGVALVYLWTPDNWIYFSRSPADREDSDASGLFRIHPDGTGMELIADIDDDCSLGEFSVAPDGMSAVCTVQESEPDVKVVGLGG